MTTLIQILCSFICHQYLFATITHFCMIFFSSIQRHEGVGAGYWRTLPLAYQSKKKKRNCNENFGKLSSETSILQSFIQVYFGCMRMRKTTSYERLMSVLNMRKKACLRNFRHVQRCARAIASSYDET